VLTMLLLCRWDTGYILARPHSFAGGKWHWIWKPYGLYGDIDYIYSRKQYELKNGFTAAQGQCSSLKSDRSIQRLTPALILIQGSMNIVETILNFLYVYMATGRPELKAVSPLIGLSVALMTFWKTVLYWLQVRQCLHYYMVSHADFDFPPLECSLGLPHRAKGLGLYWPQQAIRIYCPLCHS
jgi:hypothetical protein